MATTTIKTLEELKVCNNIVSADKDGNVVFQVYPTFEDDQKIGSGGYFCGEGAYLGCATVSSGGIVINTGSTERISVNGNGIIIASQNTCEFVDGDETCECRYKGSVSKIAVTTEGISIGQNATVGGVFKDSIAIGNSSGSESYSVSVGWSAKSTTNSVSIGGQACSGALSVSIGDGAKTSTDAISIGSCSEAASNAIAIGSYACAKCAGGIAIGACACSGDGEIILRSLLFTGTAVSGCNTLKVAKSGTLTVNNDEVFMKCFESGVVLGENASNGGYSSGISIGYCAKSFCNGTIAIGNFACALGDRSIAIGDFNGYTQSKASYGGIVIGNGNVSAVGNEIVISSINTCSYCTQCGETTTFKIGQDGVISINGEELQTGLDISNGIVIGEGATVTCTITDCTYVDNIAIGTCAVANHEGSIAIGSYFVDIFGCEYTTKATGYNSVAIGTGATTSGLYSTALGINATASGDNSTALGHGACAEGDFSTALGHASSASGGCSTALGSRAEASGECSTALGRCACATETYSTALGTAANATGVGALAIGYSARASENEIVLRSQSSTPAAFNILKVSCDGVLSINNDNVFVECYKNGIIIGEDAASTDGKTTNVVIGCSATAGEDSRSNCGCSVVIGICALGNGSGTVGIGACANACGIDSVAIGRNSITKDGLSVAIGSESCVTGSYSVAVGSNSCVDGMYSTSIGYTSKATSGGVAIGDRAVALAGEVVIKSSKTDSNNQKTYNTLMVSSSGQLLVNGTEIKSGYTPDYTYGVAVGDDANIGTCGLGVAVGNYSTATGSSAISLGSNTYTSGEFSISIGYGSSNHKKNSIAIGNSSYSSTANGIAIGCSVYTTSDWGTGGIVIGTCAKAAPGEIVLRSINVDADTSAVSCNVLKVNNSGELTINNDKVALEKNVLGAITTALEGISVIDTSIEEGTYTLKTVATTLNELLKVLKGIETTEE